MSRQISNTKVESTRQPNLVLTKSVQKPIINSPFQSSQQKSGGYKQTSFSCKNLRTGTLFFDNEGEKNYYKKSSQNASKNQEAVETVKTISNEEDKEATHHLLASTYLDINEGLVNGLNKPKSQMSKSSKDLKSMPVDEQVRRKQLMQRHLSAIEAMEQLDLNEDPEIVKQAMDQLFQQNIVQLPNETEVWAGLLGGSNDRQESKMSSPSTDRTKMQAKVAGGSGAVRQRRGGAGTSGTGGGTVRTRANGVNTGGLWRFYTEDSTGLKIGPVPVLVLSLVFIASVFVLHIWGKYTRASTN